MIFSAEFAWIIPGLAVIAFCITSLFGKNLPYKGIFLPIAAALLGFIFFCLIFVDFISTGFSPTSVSIDWIVIDNWSITWGFAIDEISILMLGLVTFISLLVQIYSVGYMSGDSRISWYFAVHALFAGAMLALVLADNLLFLYFCWELVGLGSYLLIGFWFEKKAASEAAKKAFITTRLGDVGLLIGIILLFKATGTFHIPSIIHAAQNGAIPESTLIWSSLLLFLGAMGKSAQFPFHVWLPDAMEGPTPVSALIHAATMVVAGVYLIARMLPLLEIVPGFLTLVATVGLFTFLFAGIIALVMTDIKKVLAYSTISHLGLMVLTLGAGGLAAAMFHLVVHGFSKALLFLGAGSVMHGLNGETDCWKMGGLRRNMSVTGVTFLVGCLSLAGIVPLSGFFSKDEMLLSIHEGLGPIFLFITLAGVFLSSLYMIRLFCVIFIGEPRSEGAKNSHESPRVMTYPLVILAVFGTVLGILALPLPLGDFEGLGNFIDSKHHFHLSPWITPLSLLIALSGLVIGYMCYGYHKISHHLVALRFGYLYKLTLSKFYIDEIYQWIIDKIVLSAARFISIFDRVVVNDTGVDGIGVSVLLSAFKVRLIQTGKLYNYAAAMGIGIFFMAVMWILVSN